MKTFDEQSIRQQMDEITGKATKLYGKLENRKALKEILPTLSNDVFLEKWIAFRFVEEHDEYGSRKFYEYRMYDDSDGKGKWLDWRRKEFDPDSVGYDIDAISFENKKFYVLNYHDANKDEYTMVCIWFYAPEVLPTTYQPDKQSPWMQIEIHALGKDDAMVTMDLVDPGDASWTHEVMARHLVEGYEKEIYHAKYGSDKYWELSKEVASIVEKGILPAKVENAPIYLDMPGRSPIFTPQQGLELIDASLESVTKEYEKYGAEWIKLHDLLEMTPEERDKLLQEEERKEAEAAKRKKEETKQKAAERAAKKAAKEAEEEKKSKLYWTGIFVWLVSLMLLCGVPALLDDYLGLDMDSWVYIAIIIGGIIIVKYAWKAVKKALKRKWGIKDEE